MNTTTDSRRFYLGYTREEQKLIDKHLPFYIALDKGKRVPNTEKQKHFVRCCRGLEKANTPHEFVYLKYKRIKKYEESQKIKSYIASSRSKRKNRQRDNICEHNDSPASAREIIQAQDKAMKLQVSKKANVRNAMAVHSDPRD